MAYENDAVSPPDIDNFTVVITPLDAAKLEGNSGVTPFTPFTFTMTLIGDTSVARDIWWDVSPFQYAYSDFYPPIGQVHFAAGETSKEFIVPVLGDTNLEADETFTITALRTGTSQPFGTPGQGVILADDNGFAIAARTPWVREGSDEVQYALFNVTRFGDASSTDTVTWSAVQAGYQQANAADFVGGVLPQGFLTFLPGETSKTITLAIAPDTVLEPSEEIEVSISASPWRDSVTIVNDDATVELRRISDQAEGDSGTTNQTLELIRSGDTSVAHSVTWTVSAFPLSGIFPDSLGHYSADAADFVGGTFPSGTVTFDPGETRKTFTVPVAGDTLSETGEQFLVQLSNPSQGLAIEYDTSWGYITNDDPLPVVAHDDAYVTIEGGAVALSLFPPPGPGILGNDIGATAVALGLGPRHGTLELGARGLFTYRPDAGFHGIDSFTYTAAGPDGYDYGQATIHVVPVVQGQVPTLDLLGLTPEEQIAATYAAFMGRAADADGFAFWVDQFRTGLPTQGAKALIANIASSFAISDEARGLYAFLANPGSASDIQISTFLGSVYENLFNRSTDAAGLAYWTGQVRQKLTGGEFVGSMLVDIMSGAQHQVSGLVLNGNVATAVIVPDDLGTLMGKVAVSLEFVRAQQEHGMVWNGEADTAVATDLLKDIHSGTGSILVGIKNGDDYVAAHA